MSVSEKVKALLEKIPLFEMATIDNDGMPQIRPMGSKVVENNFVLFISSFAKARKVDQIKKHSNCQLYFHTPDYQAWFTFSGTAEIIEDQPTKTAYYSKFAKIGEYFSSDKDPNYGLIRFKTKKIELMEGMAMKPEVLEIK